MAWVGPAMLGIRQGMSKTSRAIIEWYCWTSAVTAGATSHTTPRRYRTSTLVGDVVAVLDAVGVEVCDYWGYSIGGGVGFALLASFPQRVRRFVTGAASARRPESLGEAGRRRAEALQSGDRARIARDLEVSDEIARRLVEQADLQALAALQLAALDEVGIDVSRLNLPSLHYAGERDPLIEEVRKAASEMPGARFVMIPNSDHLTAFLRSNLVLPVVREFLFEKN